MKVLLNGFHLNGHTLGILQPEPLGECTACTDGSNSGISSRLFNKPAKLCWSHSIMQSLSVQSFLLSKKGKLFIGSLEIKNSQIEYFILS